MSAFEAPSKSVFLVFFESILFCIYPMQTRDKDENEFYFGALCVFVEQVFLGMCGGLAARCIRSNANVLCPITQQDGAVEFAYVRQMFTHKRKVLLRLYTFCSFEITYVSCEYSFREIKSEVMPCT